MINKSGTSRSLIFATAVIASLPQPAVGDPMRCSDPFAGPGDPMTREAAGRFVQRWAADWNALAIDAVVDHLAPEAQMRSPLAEQLLGDATVRGKEAIRQYWYRSYGTSKEPGLTVSAFSWDPASCRLNIWWTARTARGPARASEFMDFGPDGKIIRGEAFYGK